MFKKLSHGLSILIVALFLAGCASGTGSVRTRAYVMEKERVDQSMEGGNYGYIFGTPVPEDRSKFKKTRQMHVLEFTKEDEEPEDMTEPLLPPPPPRPQASTPPPRQERRRPPVEEKYEPVVLPNFDEEPAMREPEPRQAAPRPSATGSYTEYTIEKDDTLQKISKKFYDTYRKWPQIYEANKDKIKDPNRIKPGLTIRIPAE